jgi:hypothetical protein
MITVRRYAEHALLGALRASATRMETRFEQMGKGMNRKRNGIVWGAALILLAGFFTTGAQAGPKPVRADVIIIDSLKAFGPLERPPVVFWHDKHTQALAQQGKDCLACHPMHDKHLSFKFQRIENTDKQRVMKIYHARCIGCHKQNKAQHKATGPVACGDCHVKVVRIRSDWRPIHMDRSLHYRHIKANDSQCGRCHHQYNPKTKTLYYAKGQEEACVYCHKAQTEDNRISIQLASHISCIACHRSIALQGKHAGPLECSGCHSPILQARIKRVANPPRLERNQPDFTLIRTHGPNEPPGAPAARMARVPFNHKAHEGYTDSCIACHHSALTSCAGCHSIAGKPQGAQVKLAQAMHQQDAHMSCVGCHKAEQKKPACAGCHESMPPEKAWTSEAACKVCHVPYDEQKYPQDAPGVQHLAADLLASRGTEQKMVAVTDIPEKVTIDHLVNDFKAVQMPHRKMVLRMAELIRDNRLASTFHTQATTLCQGCHHHSPPSLKPPRCGSCHGRTSDVLNPNRPGLLAAFHDQCIKCHKRMGITKPAEHDCTVCHAQRAATQNKN